MSIYGGSHYNLQTKADVSPITDSTGAESSDVSDMFPSQAGLAVLSLASVGINCTTNAVVSLDTPSYKRKNRIMLKV